jgi:hypothetical protein
LQKVNTFKLTFQDFCGIVQQNIKEYKRMEILKKLSKQKWVMVAATLGLLRHASCVGTLPKEDIIDGADLSPQGIYTELSREAVTEGCPEPIKVGLKGQAIYDSVLAQGLPIHTKHAKQNAFGAALHFFDTHPCIENPEAYELQ